MTPRTAGVLRWGVFALLVLATVLWAAGAFERGRVEPGHEALPSLEAAPLATGQAERTVMPVYEEAVGTVGSRRRVVLAAQVTGRILTVGADVGATVQAGERLVAIDARELEAAFAQAKAHYERTKRFLARNAATQAEMETAEAQYVQARTALAHARVESPIDGVVAERQVEPGDLAWPGRPLFVVLDSDALRLEAQVREGLIAAVEPGATVPVLLPAARRTLEGVVAEVLPAADPQSRSFTARVNLPEAPDVRPGMFGRLRLPAGVREVVHVPAAAIRRVGQLETVLVREADRWERRLVTTGAPVGEDGVEVLSGLAGGETVGLPVEAR